MIGLALLAAGCAPRRKLQVENTLLRDHVVELQRQVLEMERIVPDPQSFVRAPDLQTVAEYLGRAGYDYDFAGEGDHIQFEYIGRHTSFRVLLRIFEGADVLFVTTGGYFSLDDAAGTDSLVMLMVQLATLNYELLLGKFQLDPHTGDVLLSMELSLADGLGYDTLSSAVDHLVRTADARYPELSRAAHGRGL